MLEFYMLGIMRLFKKACCVGIDLDQKVGFLELHLDSPTYSCWMWCDFWNYIKNFNL